MANLTDLPNELLVAILEHNVPRRLTNRSTWADGYSWADFRQEYAVSRRILDLAQDVFFLTYQHQVFIDSWTLRHSLSQREPLPGLHGPHTGRSDFSAQVRRVNMTVFMCSFEDPDAAIDRFVQELKWYPQANEVKVEFWGTHTTKAENDSLEEKLVIALCDYKESVGKLPEVYFRMRDHFGGMVVTPFRPLC